MRTTNNISITLPPTLIKQAEQAAKREGMTKSELFREALRRFIIQSEFRDLAAAGKNISNSNKFKPTDVEKAVKSYRKQKKYAEGGG